MLILAEQLISLAEEQRHDYRRELADFKIYFNEQGVLRRVELTCDIVALVDGLTKVEAVAEYLADLNPGVVSIEPLAGCDLASLEETPDRSGHVFAELSIPPLSRGDRYSYTYRIVVKSEKQSKPIFYHEVVVPTDALSFLLWFKELQPAYVWPIRGVPSMQLPGRERNYLPWSQDGIYRHRFSGARIGACYGLGWRWPTTGRSSS